MIFQRGKKIITAILILILNEWNRLKQKANEFVIIKLGEAYNVDEYFEEHMTAALEAGLEVGVYYFSHAYIPEATAVQEAEWVINTLNAYGYT